MTYRKIKVRRDNPSISLKGKKLKMIKNKIYNSIMLVLWICGVLFMTSLFQNPGMYTDRSYQKEVNLSPATPLNISLIPESGCIVSLYHEYMGSDYEYQIWVDGSLYIDDIIHKTRRSTGTIIRYLSGKDVGLGNITIEATGQLIITFYQSASNRNIAWVYEHQVITLLIFALWPIPSNIIFVSVKKRREN
jgi:hypothetical protein